MDTKKIQEIENLIIKEIEKGNNMDVFFVSSLFFDLMEENKEEFIAFFNEFFKKVARISLSDSLKIKLFKMVFDFFDDQVFNDHEFVCSFLRTLTSNLPKNSLKEIIPLFPFDHFNKDFLFKLDSTGKSIYHWLALWADIINWTTTDKEILKHRDSGGWTVAHYLASNKKLTVKDPEILDLDNNNGIKVKVYLK